jgi:hypothetical protein
VGREVIGVDCVGQWPGADDNEAGSEFVRYLFQAPETGGPDDLVPEPEPARDAPGPRRQPVTTV